MCQPMAQCVGMNTKGQGFFCFALGFGLGGFGRLFLSSAFSGS